MNVIEKEAVKSLFENHDEYAGYESIVNSMIELGHVTTVFTVMQLNFGLAQKYMTFLTDDHSNDIIFIRFDHKSALSSPEAQRFLLTKKIETIKDKKMIEEHLLEINKKLDIIETLIINYNLSEKDDLIEDYCMDHQKAYLARNIPHK